jgi:hypothetical protein
MAPAYRMGGGASCALAKARSIREPAQLRSVAAVQYQRDFDPIARKSDQTGRAQSSGCTHLPDYMVARTRIPSLVDLRSIPKDHPLRATIPRGVKTTPSLYALYPAPCARS